MKFVYTKMVGKIVIFVQNLMYPQMILNSEERLSKNIPKGCVGSFLIITKDQLIHFDTKSFIF